MVTMHMSHLTCIDLFVWIPSRTTTRHTRVGARGYGFGCDMLRLFFEVVVLHMDRLVA